MSAEKNKKVSEALAIVCLLLNILIIPGLGSLIGKKTKQGLWQIILLFGGIILGLVLLSLKIMPGIALMIIGPVIAWIWGIVTGVNLISESSK
jgi:hypothetical protein